MEEILKFTPESIEPPAELEPNPSNKDDIVSVDRPKASSTPQRKACSRLKWEEAKLRRKMQNIKREVEAAKRESEKFRKRIERLKKMKPEKQKAKSTEGDRSSPVAIQRKKKSCKLPPLRWEQSLTAREKGHSHKKQKQTTKMCIS